MLPRSFLRTANAATRPRARLLPLRWSRPAQRQFADKSKADKAIEDIQDQYAMAKDEFDIAQEETDKQTVYAEEDRNAAREQLTKLERMYREAIETQEAGIAEEIKNRVGHRIRELSSAVTNMEKQAQEQD